MTESDVQEKVDSCIARLLLWEFLYNLKDCPPEIAKRKVTLLEDVISDCQCIAEFCIIPDASA